MICSAILRIPTLLLISHLSHASLFCNPMDNNLPGSSVHGIFWARILEWVAIPYSRASKWPRDGTHVSCIAFFNTEPLGRPITGAVGWTKGLCSSLLIALVCHTSQDCIISYHVAYCTMHTSSQSEG